MFNVFVSTCSVDFRTTHGQNNTRKCDTEGLVPASILRGVVGSPYSFIRSFIGKPERYDMSYTLMQNEHILPELEHVP